MNKTILNLALLCFNTLTLSAQDRVVYGKGYY